MLKLFTKAFAALILLSISNVYACDPILPSSSSYNYDITFNSDKLSGLSVKIERAEQPDEPDYYYLKNSALEPIYIFREVPIPQEAWHTHTLYGDEYVFPQSGLPERFEPRFKLVEGHVYYYDTDMKQTNPWQDNETSYWRLAEHELFKHNTHLNKASTAKQAISYPVYYKGKFTKLSGYIQFRKSSIDTAENLESKASTCNDWPYN